MDKADYMYKRKEVIEEEHLDWDKKTRNIIQDKDTKVSRPPNVKRKNNLLNKESRIEENPHIHSSVMNYIDKYEYSLLIPIILIVPYIVGFLFNSVLFYKYSGITLVKAFSIEYQHNIFELWSIGAYTFVTLGTIGILLQTFKESR